MSSKVTSDRFPFKGQVANQSGHLVVSTTPPHNVYYEEYGNKLGEPIFFIHGGPGGGTTPALSGFFDPTRYRIVLFDQRGCGKSIPSASVGDSDSALQGNTTDDLISDILKIRDVLGITSKIHLFGGSWGSTLALAFAIKYPELVQSLILRGIFLIRKVDLDYFYQGNAAAYHLDPFDAKLCGAYVHFPEAWKAYVEAIPVDKRGDMIKAYSDVFNQNDLVQKQKCALAWSIWEGVTSYLTQDYSKLDKFADPQFAMAFARIENHYFMNGAFLGGEGEANRNQNYILENCERIKNIPISIVQGRYDVVCPRFAADELVAKLTSLGAKVDYRVTNAGHSALDEETFKQLC
eukprot:PhF_6_TR14511/c0_g1_i1/m.23050/K01259/pip; proline iminopeptidase